MVSISHNGGHDDRWNMKMYVISVLLLKVKTCYGCNPDTGIDMTTTSENRGRQIQTTEIS